MSRPFRAALPLFSRPIEVAEQGNNAKEGSRGARMRQGTGRTRQSSVAEIQSSFSYLGRAVATAGVAAHRLAFRVGFAATAAAAEARAVVVFDAAAEGVAARREARMVEGFEKVLSEGEEKKSSEKNEELGWLWFFVLFRRRLYLFFRPRPLLLSLAFSLSLSLSLSLPLSSISKDGNINKRGGLLQSKQCWISICQSPNDKEQRRKNSPPSFFPFFLSLSSLLFSSPLTPPWPLPWPRRRRPRPATKSKHARRPRTSAPTAARRGAAWETGPCRSRPSPRGRGWS